MEITAIEPYYDVGTATLNTSTRNMTGQSGVQWLANVVPGDQVFGADGRMGGVVETVNSNTSITLAKNWRGANQSAGVYTIQRISDSVRVERFSQRLLNLLTGGNLTALGDIALAANKGFHATGQGALATHDLTPFARTLLDDANAEVFYATLGAVPNAQIRNDLPTDKAFRRGNILGPVSQSGGVPTQAFIERGSTPTGEYVRFADGTQITFHQDVTFTRQSSGLAGANLIYPANYHTAGVSPVAVVSRPHLGGSYTGDISINSVGSFGASAGTSTGMSLYYFRIDGTAIWNSGTITGCRVAVFGRWI